MNYDRIYLTIDRDEAAKILSRRVSGVERHESSGYYEYVSPLGFHLAELSDATLPNGEAGAVLKYRTGISPFHYTVRQKASRIRAVLEKHRYER